MDTIKKKEYILKFTFWIILGSAILFRVAQFLSNRSFWRDEARLLFNITERDYLGLTSPLIYGQIAPCGFLIVVKFITSIFGNTELALRLFPFLCSIASLLLFYKLSKTVLSTSYALIALALMSFQVALIYYASELKQYSCDLAVSLILLLSFFNLEGKKELSISSILFFSICGGVCTWLSHASVFILLSIIVCQTVKAVFSKNFKKLFILCSIYLFWFTNLLLHYKLCMYRYSDSTNLALYWEKSFMPKIVFSGEWWNWIINSFLSYSNFLSLPHMSLLLFFLGCFFLFKIKKSSFFILILPVVFTLAASYFHKYPIFSRLILFLCPSIFIFITKGLEIILKKTSRIFPMLGIILIPFLLYKPIYNTYLNFINPISMEEIKPSMRYVKEHLKKGDVIYLNQELQYAFNYYAKEYKFSPNFNLDIELSKIQTKRLYHFPDYSLILGGRLKNFEELDSLTKYKRVWVFLLTQPYNIEIIKYLDQLGTKLTHFERTGVAVYLYDFSKKQKEII